MQTLGPQLQDPAWKGKTAAERAFWESGGQMTFGESLLWASASSSVNGGTSIWVVKSNEGTVMKTLFKLQGTMCPWEGVRLLRILPLFLFQQVSEVRILILQTSPI